MQPARRLLRILAAIITSVAAAVLTASTPAGAVQYQITPIVNNTTVLNFPHINNNGQIVWASPNPGGQFQLNLYNNGTITQARILSTNTGTFIYELSADGGLNWEVVTNGVTHIFTNTGIDLRFRITESGASTGTITNILIDSY